MDTLLPTRHATLIAGPTASGKSALALNIAEKKDAVIINTDSMQVYDVLRIITARPSDAEEKRVPHFLYGYLDPAAQYSTGHWLAAVANIMRNEAKDRHFVFVGGTGLYFRALLGGLSPMPKIDEKARERWRYRLNEEGAGKLHRILRAQDPEAAMTLNPSDGQRIARALEVLEVSGRSILYWQQQSGSPLVDFATADKTVLMPDRERLRGRIDARFDQMIEMGALEEVRALLKRNIDPAMPAMRAIGVPQLSGYLSGRYTVEEAIELSKTATRQYAKRQMTWFRNQLTKDWKYTDPFAGGASYLQ